MASLQTGKKGDILVIPVQLELDSYGIVMVDIVAQDYVDLQVEQQGLQPAPGGTVGGKKLEI